MITAEIIPASDDFDSLRAEWDRLFGSGEREPSASFGWARAILRNHLAGNREWFVVVLRRGDAVEAIIPMLTLRERLFGREVVTIQPIQEKNNTHSDLLFGADPALLGAWLDQLFSMNRRWDVLHLARLLENAPLTAALERELRNRRWLYRMQLEQPSYFLPLPATFESYLAGRSGKFRNYLKRAEKRLAQLGEITFDCGDAGDAGGRYEEMLDIERDSWKHSHGTAISAVPHQAGFYRDLCSEMRDCGMLHLSFLRAGGVALAYNLGLIKGGRYYYLKTSYRNEYREYGIATVGRARLIRHLIGRGVPEFDFPGSPYEWEQQWTEGLRWHRSLRLFNKTLRGLALCLVTGLHGYVRGAGKRRVVFNDPRALRAPEA